MVHMRMYHKSRDNYLATVVSLSLEAVLQYLELLFVIYICLTLKCSICDQSGRRARKSSASRGNACG